MLYGVCLCGRWLRLGLWLWPRRRKTAHEKNLFSVQWLYFVGLLLDLGQPNTHMFCLLHATSSAQSQLLGKSECRYYCCCCCFLHLCNITTATTRRNVFGRKPNWTFTFCLNALFVHLRLLLFFLWLQMACTCCSLYLCMYVRVCVCVMSKTLLLHWESALSSTGALAQAAIFHFLSQSNRK